MRSLEKVIAEIKKDILDTYRAQQDYMNKSELDTRIEDLKNKLPEEGEES